MTINDIIAIGRQIAAETAEGGNTAARVGGVIEAIGEILKNQDYMSWQPAGNFDIEEYYEKNDQVFDAETNSCYVSLQTDNVGHPVNENDESYEEGWWMKVIDGASVLAAAAAATQAAAEANQAAEAARGIVYQAVDDHLDTESLKPVANQVVTQAINNLSSNLQDVEEMDLSTITIGNYRLTSTKKWTGSTAENHYWIPCAAGDVFRLTGGTAGFSYAFMKTHNNIANANANVCSIYTGTLPTCAAGQTVTITAPSDATGLAINKVVNGGDVNISKIERVTTVKDDIANLNEEVSTLSSKTQILGSIRPAPSVYVGAINASTGDVVGNTLGHTEYQDINGAKQILVYAPTLNSQTYGLMFYSRRHYSGHISGVAFSERGSTEEMKWMLIDVPYGATCFRYTTRLNTDSQYRLVVSTDYLMQLFQDSAANCLATQIFRMAKTVSPKEYLYAFGISQQAIINSKAYIPYAGSTTSVDDDRVDNDNVPLISVVDLFDMSSETHILTNGIHHYADGSVASPQAIQYSAYCPTPNGKIAMFSLMRFGNKNPYYGYCINDVDNYERSYTSCLLSYPYNGNTKVVDYTLNNYRQMLVDMGYVSTYQPSTADAADNINLHYDAALGYYAVIGAPQGSNQPIVLMQSADMATWSPVAYLGVSAQAGEIEAVYKDGIVYVCYRNNNGGMKYLIYDVDNSTLIKHGLLSAVSLTGDNMELLSKPDCFTFDNNVYMAINIDPSIFGNALNVVSYKHDARNQIAIYKIVDNIPILFRVVCNPTGLQYFSFMETPTEMVGTPPLPVYEHGAIYIAFSEDRRHLYRRQIAQVSFADVTALFADNGRIG